MIKEVNVHPVLDELNKSLDFLSKHKGLTLLITNLSTNFTMDLFINYLMSIGYDEYYVVILDRYSDNYITASTFQASVLNRYSDILKNDGIDLLSLEDSYLFTTDYKHILTLSIFDSTFSLTRDTYIDFTKYLNDINSKLKEGVNQIQFLILEKLKYLLYRYLDNTICISQVLSYIFNEDEFNKIFTFDDYEALFKINTNQVSNKYELKRIIFKYLSIAEFETYRLTKKMNEVKSNRKKLPNLIREFYSLYTSGYYFLEPLSSWSIHLDYINWDNLDEFERKKWINKNITKIIKDINKILTYFEEGKIKFIDDYEVDTFMCKYIDNRAKNKKANK